MIATATTTEDPASRTVPHVPKQESTCPNRDGGAPRIFRVGVVDVSVESDVPGIVSQYAELYHEFEIRTSPQCVRIAVRCERSRYHLTKRFSVYGDGERRFSLRRIEEIVPHVEWAVNWQIVKTLRPYLQFHAGVMKKNGLGFMFPASPGSGKTTLCAGLIAHGWSYLSDEFALIGEDGRLHPYPKALCVKEGAFDVVSHLRLPSLSPYRYKKGSKGRVAYLSPSKIGRSCIGDACQLGYVIFPTYVKGADPSLEQMSRGEAAFLLTKYAFNLERFGSHGMQLLTGAIRNAQCYRLTSGEIQATCRLMNDLVNGNAG